MPQALISDDIWLSVIQSQGAGGSGRTLCPKMHEVLGLIPNTIEEKTTRKIHSLGTGWGRGRWRMCP